MPMLFDNVNNMKQQQIDISNFRKRNIKIKAFSIKLITERGMNIICFLLFLSMQAKVLSYRPRFGSLKAVPHLSDSFLHPSAGASAYKKRVVSIALTRERQSNRELYSMLSALLPPGSCQVFEIPCIAFAEGPDKSQLETELLLTDGVVLTSPRAAATVLSVWKDMGRPAVKFAAVGAGTARVLRSAGVAPDFEASDMSANGLARELPPNFGKNILFPTSTIASPYLEKALSDRGFLVERLNVYDTVPSQWTDLEHKNALNTDIVTFASPSAVRTWADRVGSDFSAVCLGPTTYKEAQRLGLKSISYCSTSKGLEPWVDLIVSAAKFSE